MFSEKNCGRPRPLSGPIESYARTGEMPSSAAKQSALDALPAGTLVAIVDQT